MTSVCVVEASALQRIEYLPDRPVDFRDDVGIEAAGLPLELVRHEQRHVRHRVRDVEEERLLAIPLDEADRVLGVPRRQLRLIGVELDDGIVLDER